MEFHTSGNFLENKRMPIFQDFLFTFFNELQKAKAKRHIFNSHNQLFLLNRKKIYKLRYSRN